MKIANYYELARSFTESSEKNCPEISWKVRMLAELEAYLIRRGQKIDYSTNILDHLG